MKLHDLLNEVKYDEALLPKGGKLSIEYSNQSLKNYYEFERRYKSRLKDRFDKFVSSVSNNNSVDGTYQLHKMKGRFGQYDPSRDVLMDVHLLNDVVAIYVLDKIKNKINFINIGSHST